METKKFLEYLINFLKADKFVAEQALSLPYSIEEIFISSMLPNVAFLMEMNVGPSNSLP